MNAAEASGSHAIDELGSRSESAVETGRPFDVIRLLERARRAAPDDLGLAIRAGGACQRLGRTQRALRHFADAVQLDSENVGALCGLASLLLATGDLRRARACYGRALSRAPAARPAQVGMAWLETHEGQHDSARARLQGWVEGGGADPATIAVWGSACRDSGAALDALPVLADRLSRLTDPMQRSLLGHLLGDCLGQIGEHERAFAAYVEANDCTRRTYPYDSLAHSTFVDRIQAAFDDAWLRLLPPATTYLGAAGTTRTPVREGITHVLIVGMPRSGTTLVEQILGQHSGVHTCGELAALQAMSAKLSTWFDGSVHYPEAAALLQRTHCRQLLDQYTAHYQDAPTTTLCLTDKLPDNYLYLGLARAVMPDLRVVHCVRDPADTCVSAFTKNFGPGLAYTTDLTALGRRYRDHERLMAHFVRVLDIPILRLPYEDLVRQREPWIRRLLAHCGLAFEAACLHPERNPRTVATASYDQVRRPIHDGAIGRAKPYEPWLAPLYEALAG